MIRKPYLWKLKSRELRLGSRTLIMGILNVTPDSFFDGGRYDDPARAFAQALVLEDEGADIIDIGAESTRPGSKRLNEQEELRRLVPVLKKLRDKLTIPIAVDTYKASVAAKALELGAEIINDPTGLTFDPLMVKTVVGYDAGMVVNHMRGAPETWTRLAPLRDVMSAVRQDLEASVRRGQLSGLEKQRVVIDPGLGFGKRGDQNYEILARLDELAALGYPVLVGPSRKSFLPESDDGRLLGTAAAATAAVLGGAHIIRVHDVKEMVPVLRVADAVLEASVSPPEPEEREPPRPAPRPSSRPEHRPETRREEKLPPRGPRHPRPPYQPRRPR